MSDHDSSSPPRSLAAVAVRGVAVTGISQVLRIILQVGSVIVLARLLAPADYGLVTMVLAVVGVAELFRDLGLSPAAIRAERLSEGEQSNLFWLNTGMGLGLSLLVAAGAPLLAWAYGRHELVAITMALAPTFLLSGLATQYRVRLTRALQFTRLAVVDLVTSALALVIGVGVALAHAGYWALVAQQVSSGVIAVVALILMTRWRPGRYDRQVSIAGFVRLGMSFVLGALLGYVTRNADSVVVGRLYGATTLGLYNRSVQLVRTPLGQLQAPFGTVVLPIMAAARDDDDRLLRTAVRAQVAFSYPVLGGVALIVADAHDFIRLALGSAWVGAAPVMSFVAIAGGLYSVAYAALWIFAARGLGRAMNQFNLVSTTLTLGCLAIGSQLGVAGVAGGLAFAALLGWPTALWFLHRGGIPDVRRLAAAGIRAMATAATACLLAREARAVLDGLSLPGRLTVTVLVVAAVGAAAAAVPAVRRDYCEILAMARLLGRRSASPAEPVAPREDAAAGAAK